MPLVSTSVMIVIGQSPSPRSLVDSWLTTSWTAVAMTALSALCVYAGVILLARVAGLRSFSQMSAFDFVVTVAIGALIGTSVASKNPPLLQGLVALATLFGLQLVITMVRRSSPRFQKGIDTAPLLLMAGPHMIQAHMKSARVTEHDLWMSLRKASVSNLSQVRAAVMETTGEVTVIVHEPEGPRFDYRLLSDVRGAELLDEYRVGEEEDGEGGDNAVTHGGGGGEN